MKNDPRPLGPKWTKVTKDGRFRITGQIGNPVKTVTRIKD